ncbi:MAG: hypothetical protein KGD63_12565 [Candidatus Lokiarchaeota archaeon]|nr:hypothetical protein [Candidatus Lokiarchaeota archaeon]
MEKSKFAIVSLIIALISLFGPILSILAFLEIIPIEGVFGTYAVSGMALLAIIIGGLGWKETEKKWIPISTFIIAIVGMIITYAIGMPIIIDMIYDMFPPP